MDPIKVRVGYGINRVAHAWRTRLGERLSALGLTQAKWVLLTHLDRMGGSLGQKELTGRSGVEGPTVVRVLDGLERMGLIERRENRVDRRSKDIHLTSSAKPLMRAINDKAREFREEALQGVSEEELAVCERVFERVARNLGISIY